MPPLPIPIAIPPPFPIIIPFALRCFHSHSHVLLRGSRHDNSAHSFNSLGVRSHRPCSSSSAYHSDLSEIPLLLHVSLHSPDSKASELLGPSTPWWSSPGSFWHLSRALATFWFLSTTLGSLLKSTKWCGSRDSRHKLLVSWHRANKVFRIFDDFFHTFKKFFSNSGQLQSLLRHLHLTEKIYFKVKIDSYQLKKMLSALACVIERAYATRYATVYENSKRCSIITICFFVCVRFYDF